MLAPRTGRNGRVGRQRKSRAERGQLKRWNRFSLKFFGPPHIGVYEGAYPQVDPDPPCPFCGQPESEHTTYRSADGKTLRRCPTVQADQ